MDGAHVGGKLRETHEDVAEVVYALIEHMHFVTGETVIIDGGFANTT